MDGNLSRSSSTVTTHGTLRPRASRSRADHASKSRISDSSGSSALVPPQSSPSRSRSRSPLAQPYPPHRSESANSAGNACGRASPADRSLDRLKPKGSAPSLAALWGTSWTAIQGIANDFLVSDGSDSEPSRRRRVPKSGLVRSVRSGGQNDKEWGPQGDTFLQSAIGQGSGREERDALAREQKRKTLLSGGPSVAFADSSGRYKRRTSDDRGLLTETGNEQGLGDALVYVHLVDPKDTLAGITIKYGCAATTLRKANRMWPNDSIQIRRVLVLPVAECSIKGRPTVAPSEESVTPQQQREEMIPEIEHPTRDRAESISDNSRRSATSMRLASELEQSWTHDSWTLLPDADTPTQIVRLPRQALGYFPPARRKSQSNSELDSRATSFDVGRPSMSDDPSGSSPGRPVPKPRRPSNAANGYFPSYLAGPGGVGTMDRNVKTPGPAQDGLNKLFANHLPNVAPPTNQHGLYLPETPLFVENSTGFLTPGLDPGRQSPRINLEGVGGVIESWMRKVATRASSVLEPLDRREPTGIGAGQSGRSGTVGDLIEMADSIDIGHDEDDSDDEVARGRKGSDGGMGWSSVAVGTSSLQSRVPGHGEDGARSRVRSTGKAAAGKDD